MLVLSCPLCRPLPVRPPSSPLPSRPVPPNPPARPPNTASRAAKTLHGHVRRLNATLTAVGNFTALYTLAFVTTGSTRQLAERALASRPPAKASRLAAAAWALQAAAGVLATPFCLLVAALALYVKLHGLMDVAALSPVAWSLAHLIRFAGFFYAVAAIAIPAPSRSVIRFMFMGADNKLQKVSCVDNGWRARLPERVRACQKGSRVMDVRLGCGQGPASHVADLPRSGSTAEVAGLALAAALALGCAGGGRGARVHGAACVSPPPVAARPVGGRGQGAHQL
jgi:hypothetical protein